MLKRSSPYPKTRYFHCYWNRQVRTRLGEDYQILPQVTGRGRLLGVNVGVLSSSDYGDSWWGEGEVKIYLDGDDQHPTIAGTGTEDYIGTAWGLGKFSNRYQGCTVADAAHRMWAFYRFHIPDLVFFEKDMKVTIQAIGGSGVAKVREFVKRGLPVIPVSVDLHGRFTKLLEPGAPNKMHESSKKIRAAEELEEVIAPSEYEVRGIFEVGYFEFDYKVVVCSLANAQELFGLEDGVMGLMVMLQDPSQANAVKSELRSVLPPRYGITTWGQDNAGILDALLVEKNVMFDGLFHVSVILDIMLEATWIDVHEHVGFYLCAAAFAVVLIGYRLWWLRGRSTAHQSTLID